MKSSFSSSAALLGALATVAALAVGCGGATSSDADGVAQAGGAAGAEGDAESSEEELRASCTNPRRYFATFREGTGTCAPIAARRGQWLPESLFADAPADVQISTCTYQWSGEKYSRPDQDALRAAVGAENGLAPACGKSSVPDVGLLQPIPYIDIWTQAGSVGCDVCGIVRNGRIWVVLPPEKIARKQFEVRLSDGRTRAFQIEARTDARALSIALPAAPAGTTYQQGRVHLY